MTKGEMNSAEMNTYMGKKKKEETKALECKVLERRTATVVRVRNIREGIIAFLLVVRN